MNIDELETGDILLACHHSTGWFEYFLDIIRYSTHSPYVHIGLVLKDPEFIDTKLKGVFIWESGFEGTPDPQDGQEKLGVQITPIHTFIGNYKGGQIIVRRLKDNSVFSVSKLREIHKCVYDKPYDINPRDWLYALFRKDIERQKTDRFWCSAFVGYVLTQLGILDKSTDWSVMYPCDFALDGEKLEYTSDNILEPWEKLIDINSI